MKIFARTLTLYFLHTPCSVSGPDLHGSEYFRPVRAGSAKNADPKNWPHVTFYFDHVPHLQSLLTYLRICLGRVVLSLTSAVAVVILGFSSPTYYQRYFIILHYSYIYSNYRYKSYLLYLDFEVSRSNTSVEKFHCGQRILFADSNMIFIISLWAKTCLKDIGIVCKCKCLLF